MIVRNKAAKSRPGERVHKPVRYAISTVLKYAKLGGINQEARDAVAEVKRQAAAQRAELARQAAPPRAMDSEPPPSAEEVAKCFPPEVLARREAMRRKPWR